jgi:hypothetical protein
MGFKTICVTTKCHRDTNTEYTYLTLSMHCMIAIPDTFDQLGIVAHIVMLRSLLVRTMQEADTAGRRSVSRPLEHLHAASKHGYVRRIICFVET